MAAPFGKHGLTFSRVLSLRIKGYASTNFKRLPCTRWSSNRSYTSNSRYTHIIAGTIAAAATGTLSFFAVKNSLLQSVYAASADNLRPHYEPIRRVVGDKRRQGLRLTLYQYQTCPFCCKVRAFLDFYGFSYDVIEVNSVWRTQTKWSKYKKVPLLVVEGVGDEGYLEIMDSSVIISLLTSYMTDTSQSLEQLVSYYPGILPEKGKKLEFPNRYFIMYGERTPSGTPEKRKEERMWRSWVDNELVHMISPNVYRTPSEALQAFHYFSEVGEWDKVFSSSERQVVIYVGAFAMYIIGKMLKSKYRLKSDVRESLYDTCNEWVRSIKKKKTPFMGGDQPNLADLSVYGALTSFEGCTAFEDLLENTTIKAWFYKTKAEVQKNAGSVHYEGTPLKLPIP